MRAYERARRGIAYVPQGREIFPLLTVRENLETGFARLPGAKRKIPEELFELFPVLKSMLGRRGGDLSGGQQQQLAIARALVMRAAAARARRADRGHPALHHQGHRPRHHLSARAGQMAILLVEQYFDFARALADTYAVMERGEVVLAGEGATWSKATFGATLPFDGCAALRWATSVLQARSWLPRTEGSVRLGVRAPGRANRISTSCTRPARRARAFPSRPRARRPEAVLLNTAGGLTGGDRMDLEVTLGARRRGDPHHRRGREDLPRARWRAPSEIGVKLALGAGARLAWLPQATILFDGSRLDRRTEVRSRATPPSSPSRP